LANVDLDYKELEITRGFLVHLSMTFDMLTHHLKGFLLSLASHLPGRCDDGWKLNESEWLAYMSAKVEQGVMKHEEVTSIINDSKEKKLVEPPTSMMLTQHLQDDIIALHEFFESSTPPEVQARRQAIHLLLYGFADASGGGLGSTITMPGIGIRCRVGVWGKDDESNSSNFKEFENVVQTIEQESRSGLLKGPSLYLFTDNSTVEGALFKGNTPSRKIFHLIMRFRKVQMLCDAEIIVLHVSGKRMIAQGTDGVSCGLLNEGVTTGLDMLAFIPLHLTAIERNPSVKEWIVSWLGREAEFLLPSEWFTRRHSHCGGYYDKQGFWRLNIKPGKFVWASPPAAAEVAVEELWKALIKIRDCTHVFICPRLLTPQWHRQLNKACDLVLFMPTGSEIWPIEMFEPLTIGFVFPFLSSRPWQLRGTPKMLHLGRTMSHLLKDMDVVTGNLLRELCKQMWELQTMPEDVVRKMLYFGS
jgi:hypothetical protein